MVKQLGDNTAVVTVEELGTNCWHPCRFIRDDGRCCRVFVCNYPEKKACQAVTAEIAYLKQSQVRMCNSSIQIDHTIETLAKMLEK